ncbi:unnamed protein product [Meganyctiphanes norvegica]|uniref:Ig-like domain-containing protein n=1 Tax=Meganyctiphanes norvegica TaxID=48144 RepID=A0AAV2RY92_MEGNR
MVSNTHVISLNEIILLIMKVMMFDISGIDASQSIEYNTDACKIETTQGIYYKQKLLTANCSFSNLKNIPLNIPDNIELLNLSGNVISVIYISTNKLTHLREIDLSKNKIHLINMKVKPSNISRIVYLNLDGNHISTLFQEDFKYFETLEYISLSRNQINYIDDDTFSGLINLKYLVLESNSITTLSNKWFKGMNNIKSLNLRYNHISHIPASVFQDLSSLEKLFLSGNTISIVDPRSFSGLIRLKLLSLANNNMSWVPTAALQSLPNLENLILDKNPVLKIKPLDFSHLPVKNISVSEMPSLKIIDSKAFYNLVNLSYLYVHSNPNLIYINPQAIKNIKSLQGLYLHNNKLRGLDPVISESNLHQINITLHGNPFHCDCNIHWIRQLSVTSNNSISNTRVFISHFQDILCKTPIHTKNKSILDKSLENLPKICPPTFLEVPTTETATGRVGEHQVLECYSIGVPSPQMHWILPDKSVINSTLNEIRRRFFPPATLVYYHLEPMDMGKYTCVAENSAGTISRPTVLYIKGIDVHLYVKRLLNNFSLIWNGSDIKFVSSYVLKYKDLSNINSAMKYLTTVNSSQFGYTVENINHNSTIEYCLGYGRTNGNWFPLSCCKLHAELTHSSIVQLFFHIIVIISFTFLLISLVCIVNSIIKKEKYSYNGKCNNKPLYKYCGILNESERQKFSVERLPTSSEIVSSKSPKIVPEISSISRRLSLESSQLLHQLDRYSSETDLPFS